MEKLEIRNVELTNLHVTISQDKIDFTPEMVQAMLQVRYNFKQIDRKLINYSIVVGEDNNHGLFFVKCDYTFTIDDNTYFDDDIVERAIEVLQPRIEELLSFIAIESGLIDRKSSQTLFA